MTSPAQNPTDLRAFVGQWALDPARTSIIFRTKAMWILPVKGTAKALEGAGTVGEDGSLTGTLVIDAASIDTKNKKRDTHLRTGDFFEVETYPTITFETTSGRLVGPSKVELVGTFTVHGQTKPLTVLADISATAGTATVSTELDIDRSDWGLSLVPFGAGLKNHVLITAVFNKV
jgi:polyisoprenoid-binding protein YceI